MLPSMTQFKSAPVSNKAIISRMKSFENFIVILRKYFWDVIFWREGGILLEII